jgi:hypothetical protein
MVRLTMLLVVQVIQRRLDSCSRESLVGLTTLQAECQMNRGSNPGRGKRFMSSPKHPDRQWDPLYASVQLATYPTPYCKVKEESHTSNPNVFRACTTTILRFC